MSMSLVPPYPGQWATTHQVGRALWMQSLLRHGHYPYIIFAPRYGPDGRLGWRKPPPNLE